MASKAVTQELQALSLEAFGNKHYWRKYTTKGLLEKSKTPGEPPRRIPLSEFGVRVYMEKLIEGRKQLHKKWEEQNGGNKKRHNETGPEPDSKDS